MSVNLTNSTCINESEWKSDSFRFLVSAVVYGLVIVVGLPLNAMSLWILLRRHGLRSPGAVLMINLAASDLLLALSLPLRVYFYATLQWPFGAGTCTTAILLFRINIRMSCIFITLISVDRLLALVFPLRSRSLRTPAFACKCSLLVWTLITILCIQECVNLYRALKECHHHMSCFEFQVVAKSSRTTALGQAIFLLILLVVNIVSTIMVIVVLRKRPNSDATKVNNKMSVMLIFVVNMLVFIVFFLPFTLQLLTLEEKNDGEVLRAFICLASINCCLDPLIYYFSLDSFWQDKGKIQTDVASQSLSRLQDRL
ncbi:lysophosphatidic acid receptor 4-like [Myxocyprinus asiaticus]|uniref:lysophosphatidic acid receptor 4-like n=1 Tax=Myxocyprinus asiaticus TaxID=70543 RepID=UPI0022234F4C|nr:lysophosphatidic acid receptor 4-like [Myxocyprinus asiaticus]